METKAKSEVAEVAEVAMSPRFKNNADFLDLSYEELKERNLKLKESYKKGEASEEESRKTLNAEPRIKAVTVCFSDMEGQLQTLDYDKEYFLNSSDNLTFDGSSIKGFTPQHTSDLRLAPDWSSLRFTPADVFGAGKVILFANIQGQDGKPYVGDFRSNLKLVLDELRGEHGLTVNAAPEIEGFIFDGRNAEQNFDEKKGFEPASLGGYFNTLPQDKLRKFIDRVAEATRAMGFENEKDHGEVAPSQFELNYKYAEALYSADQIQIYKLVARQIAKGMGLTASFLPKPIPGINGSGMHTNISMGDKEGKNRFYDKDGEWGISKEAHDFVNGVLAHAKENCLVYSSSVNAYRRLDPHFEAPNQIKVSHSDRGSMVRIPLAKEKSARIEIRTVAPDANPYLVMFMTLRAGMSAMFGTDEEKARAAEVRTKPIKKLPGTIQGALRDFERSEFVAMAMGEENKEKYLDLKRFAARRSPEDLGTKVKNREVLDHHEVTNQSLRNDF